MESGMRNYPVSRQAGLMAEVRYDDLRRGHVLRRASKVEDMIEGWDRLDDEFGKVGIKARCALRRGESLQDKFFPFELLNRDGVSSGWGFKPYDSQAYETTEGFLVFPRVVLLKLIFSWELSLSSSGVVWIPSEKLTPYILARI